MVTIQTLLAAHVEPTIARVFAPLMADILPRFQIDTRSRVAAFIAQATHESNYLSRLEEGLRYTTPERVRAMFSSRVPSLAEASKLLRNGPLLANTVYSNRYGNGDFASGDGWRFRGRGTFQLTFRANYRAAALALGHPYEEQPELVATPLHAVLTSAHYFVSRGCLALADAALIDEVTRKINPAMVAANERRQHYESLSLELATEGAFA